ncbi:hypothetical protein SeGA_3022, partial [Salmonella enterica subsp. enterica serovar Gaminara str. A4-567]
MLFADIAGIEHNFFALWQAKLLTQSRHVSVINVLKAIFSAATP